MRKYIIFGLILFSLIGIFLYTSRMNYKAAIANEEYVSFAIYLVDSYENIPSDKNINELPLMNTPIITNKEIKKYDWTNHKILLNDELPSVLKAPVGGYFVVMANNERIYWGSFYSIGSSHFMPKGTVITTDDKSKTISIKSIDATDPRADKRIKDVFTKLGKLKR